MNSNRSRWIRSAAAVVSGALLAVAVPALVASPVSAATQTITITKSGIDFRQYVGAQGVLLSNTGTVSLFNVTASDDKLGAITLSGLTDIDNDGQADDLAVGSSASGTATATLTQAQVDAAVLRTQQVEEQAVAARRAALGGSLPSRRRQADALAVPLQAAFGWIEQHATQPWSEAALADALVALALPPQKGTP